MPDECATAGLVNAGTARHGYKRSGNCSGSVHNGYFTHWRIENFSCGIALLNFPAKSIVCDGVVVDRGHLSVGVPSVMIEGVVGKVAVVVVGGPATQCVLIVGRGVARIPCNSRTVCGNRLSYVSIRIVGEILLPHRRAAIHTTEPGQIVVRNRGVIFPKPCGIWSPAAEFCSQWKGTRRA